MTLKVTELDHWMDINLSVDINSAVSTPLLFVQFDIKCCSVEQ